MRRGSREGKLRRGPWSGESQSCRSPTVQETSGCGWDKEKDVKRPQSSLSDSHRHTLRLAGSAAHAGWTLPPPAGGAPAARLWLE